MDFCEDICVRGKSLGFFFCPFEGLTMVRQIIGNLNQNPDTSLRRYL